jgi:adenylate cyclase
VRITGQLIDTATGAHIWADRFDGALDDIFELQDQVASNVVGVIEPKLQQSEIERAARKPTESLDAYDLYLGALAQFHKYTEESIRQAIALLERAVAIDSSYAPAAAMIGLCRMHQRLQAWGLISEAEVAEGVRLARQALEQNRDDPDTLWMAGITLWYLTGEHGAAARIIDRALALNPNSAHAWNASGWASCFQNQPNRAIGSLQHAIRLSPFDPLSWMFAGGLALSYLISRRFAEGIEWADRLLHEQPRNSLGMRLKAILCAHLGRDAEAREWLSRMLELQPGLTVAAWKASISATAFSPEMIDLYAAGLRKAGLPEE